MIQTLNNSQLVLFRTCPYKWGLRHIKKLETPSEKVDARVTGTLYHAGMEDLWNTRSIDAAFNRLDNDAADLAEMFRIDEVDDLDAVLEGLDDAVRLNKWLIRYYQQQLAEELGSWVVLGTEMPFRVRVAHGVYHTGTIDLVAYDSQENRIIVVDHKTTSLGIDVYDGRLQLDTQHIGYCFAVEELVKNGTLHADGMNDRTTICFQWHVVRRKMPSEPNVNKLAKKDCKTEFHQGMLKRQSEDGINRGMVSTRAIDTTPGIYEDALRAQEEERQLPITDDQRALLESLQLKGETVLRVTETVVTLEQVDRWKTEFKVDAKRMREAYRLPMLRTRNPAACSSPMSYRCEFKEACIDPGAESFFTRNEEIPSVMVARETIQE